MSEIIDITDLPAKVDHTFVKGDAFAHVVTILEDGIAANITSNAFSLIAKDKRDNTLINLSVGSGVTITGDGTVVFNISESLSATLPTNCEIKYRFRWDTEAKTIEQGEIKVVHNV